MTSAPRERAVEGDLGAQDEPCADHGQAPVPAERGAEALGIGQRAQPVAAKGEPASARAGSDYESIPTVSTGGRWSSPSAAPMLMTRVPLRYVDSALSGSFSAVRRRRFAAGRFPARKSLERAGRS